MIELKKVHCFFEQSGTFKNEFKKLGYDAEDYDIQNNFGETDHVIDLFAEIEKEYAILQRERERILYSQASVKTTLSWLSSRVFISQVQPIRVIIR